MLRVLISAAVILIFPVLFGQNTQNNENTFYFFYSDECPHCIQAHPFVKELEKKYTKLTFKEFEISKNEVNKEILKKKAAELNVTKAGVPLFILGKQYIVGFRKDEYEAKLTAMIENHLNPGAAKTEVSPSAAFQEEYLAITKGYEACFVDMSVSFLQCALTQHRKYDELMKKILIQIGTQLDIMNKSGTQSDAPLTKFYLDSHQAWEKYMAAEADLSMSFCKLSGQNPKECDNLPLFLKADYTQKRIQKILDDLRILTKPAQPKKT